MTSSDQAAMLSDLAQRARRAYERGRVRAGLRRTLPFAAVAALVATTAPDLALTIALAATLLLAATAAFWRGGVLARASRAGLWAGLPPLMVPVVMRMLHHGCEACGGPSLRLCIAVCTTMGILGGLTIGALAAREQTHDRLRFVATAALFAAWSGAVGCVFAGAAGLLGMAGGIILGGVPLLALARAR